MLEVEWEKNAIFIDIIIMKRVESILIIELKSTVHWC
jgi:hypothetical protein